MLCEMQVLDFWSELCIHVVAVQAEADNPALFGFGAAALAVGPFLPLLNQRSVGLRRHRLRNAPCRLSFMLGAGSKLNGTFAVVVILHEAPANALAVLAAQPVVPAKITKMTMHLFS